MKNVFLSLAMLSILALSGDNADAQQWMIGFRGGANLANQFSDSLWSGTTSKVNPGVIFGAQVDYWFNKMCALSVQILYDQKGTMQTNYSPENENGYTSSITRQAQINFDYVEIPILLKVCFGSGSFRPYVFAGPSFGIFLSGAETYNVSTVNYINQDLPFFGGPISASTVHSPDISAVAGAGISYALGSGQMLFADASYAYGLTNIAGNGYVFGLTNFNSPNPYIDNAIRVNSRDIRIAAGMLFPLN